MHTDRNQAEKAFRENEEKYRLSFGQVSDIIFSIDGEYRFSSVSPSVKKILGYKPEELIGQSIEKIANIIAPESLEVVLSNSLRIMNGEHIPDAVYIFMAKDGTRKIGEVNAAPLILDGKIIGGVGIAKDITDRKKAEEALLKSEQKYRAILDKAPDAVLIRDKHGNIVDANIQATKLFGYSKKEFIGQHISKIYTPEELERVKKVIERSNRYGKARLDDTYILRKDGQKISVDVNGSCFTVGSDILHKVIFRDMTEQRKMQEQLKNAKVELEARIVERTMELMEANTALKVLMSHLEKEKSENEEKLLTNIQGQVLPYIHDIMKDPLSKRQKDDLQMLEKNLQNIMSEFLTHLKANTSKFTPKEIQVASLIKEGLSYQRHCKDVACISKDS